MGNVLKPFTEDPLSLPYHPLLSPPLDQENENLRVFSVMELNKATNNFREDRVVNGENGSIRTFYKGSITSSPSGTNTTIAVSVMECLQDSSQALQAWREEVKSLGKHSHPNLVKFLGYCCENTKSLLVFENLHKRTLDHHIHGKKEVLSWATRIKIAIGTARGVAFLHSIKNSSLYFELRLHNIMLDEEYNAKLFYLETNKRCLEDQLRTFTYMSPECIKTYRFEMDSDVFTFGVILIELFTGSEDGALFAHLIALRDGAKKLEG